MNLTYFQRLAVLVGRRADVTSCFINGCGYAPFTKKATDLGMRFYCETFPSKMNASPAVFNHIQENDQRQILINKNYLSNSALNYVTELVVEHECVHVDQLNVTEELYQGPADITRFHPMSNFPLSLLKEAEAYGYEFLKAYNDYRLNGNYTCIEDYQSVADLLLPARYQKDRKHPQASIDASIHAKVSDERVMKEFMTNLVGKKDFRRSAIEYEIQYLKPALGYSPSQLYQTAVTHFGIQNPKEDLFSFDFDGADLDNYMTIGNRGYYQDMSLNEKKAFKKNIFVISHINRAPYDALVRKARNLNL